MDQLNNGASERLVEANMAPLKTMNTKAAQRQRDGLPMPLGLQGAFEAAQIFVISALIITIPLAVVWLAGGFSEENVATMAQLAGQIWLAIQGVPLHLTFNNGPSSATVQNGVYSLLPLGVTVIPFLLSWRAGRRLARASYTDQLWQPLLGALVVYAAAGLGTAFICSTTAVSASLLEGMLIPLIPAAIGLVIGARLEAKSWGRLIGVNAADWIEKTSQDQRWAGSYLWAVVRSGFIAFMASLSLAAALMTLNIIARWADIVGVYQGLRPGAAGGSVLTLVQLGYLPNAAIWSLAWSTGAGFEMGAGSSVSPMGTAVGPLPPIPLLAALPVGNLSFGLAAVLIPVLAGFLGGWWFVRAGENHFDEWLSLRVRIRWVSLPVSTLFLAIAIAAAAALMSIVVFWVSSGSLGIGRLTEIGPEPLTAALWLGAEVGIGVVLGSLLAPWIESESRSQ